MSETQVTQAQFEYVMDINPARFQCSNVDYEQYVRTRATSALPVEAVNWFHAIAYCNKLSIKEGKTPCYGGVSTVSDWANLAYEDIPIFGSSADILAAWNAATCNWAANGYRLPTEAEWEYAARGGMQSESKLGNNAYDFYFSGSNNACEVAWFDGNNSSNTTCGIAADIYGTKPVKSKTANALGLFDMSGNVYEWCWDWNAGYTSGAATDPTGPPSSPDNARILRGGGWYNPDLLTTNCRVSYRTYTLPNGNPSPRYGFRLASHSVE
jgi:formylglycine-generating enzyme required for sulfatase activity